MIQQAEVNMKVDCKDKLGRDVKLLDEMGQTITGCKSFDTDTKEAEIYVRANANKLLVSEGKVLLVTVKLPNAKLVNRLTGAEIK